jgi:methylated-DNA-[protein]-cysteine S-methyltransferase
MDGQSAIAVKPRPRIDRRSEVAADAAQRAVFVTDLGWFGMTGYGRTVTGLTIGHASAEDARQKLAAAATAGEADWYPELRQMLQQFAAGSRVDFRKVELALPPMTAFQQAVIEATRRIPYGRTVSYAELALKAGYPRAARAVGNVMRSNCVPILVPCHRVVASAGKLGGFSAPQGVDLKRRMLDMEAGR